MFYDVGQSGTGMRIYGETPEHVHDMVNKYMERYLTDITYYESDLEELTTTYRNHL